MVVMAAVEVVVKAAVAGIMVVRAIVVAIRVTIPHRLHNPANILDHAILAELHHQMAELHQCRETKDVLRSSSTATS